MSTGLDFDYTADLSHRLRMYEILARAGQRLREEHDFSTMLRDLALSATAMVDAYGGAVACVTDGGLHFGDYICDGDLHALNLNEQTVSGIAQHVVDTQRSYLSNEAGNDHFVIKETGSIDGFDKVVATPIVSSKSAVLGCIIVHNKSDQRDFYAEDVSMLELLSGNAAMLMELLTAESERKQAVQKMLQMKMMYKSVKN